MWASGATWRSGEWSTSAARHTDPMRASGTHKRIPCQNPPFGELVAVDLASGDIAWRSALGRIEALEAMGVHDTGSVNLGGSIATAGGLVFLGASNDSRLHAYDSKSGKLLWETKLEASAHANPMTFMGRDGRQYVAVMAEGGGAFLGGGISNTLVAFALPDVPRKPLPVSEAKHAAGAATEKHATPASGNSAPAVLPPGGAKALMERTCGTACHSVEV